MSKFRVGKKSLRLLVFMLMLVCMLSGCGESRYAPIEPMEAVQAQSENLEAVAFTIGDTETKREDTVRVSETERSDVETVIVYEDIHDWVVVTADALNVRAEDNTNARIYVQLHPGDILERTGYHEEWSRIVYDGDVAYVATAMVEVTKEPIEQENDAANPDLADGTAGEDVTALADVDGEDFVSEEDGIPIYKKTGQLPKEVSTVPFNGHVVAIDAGHQAKANAEKEPIGPGSSTKKAKMPEGAVGAATGIKEFELTLTVAKKLETELKERGYEVVMIRTGHDVNLSNAERSVIANESGADVFVRLHANSMENSSIYGALAMCMTEYNPYNSELHQESYDLSKKIINNICKLTGTKNRGVQKVDNSSAINWCTIPVSVIEMGFLTNPDEDRWLQSEEYQGKIVEGIAEALDVYFAESEKEAE